MLLSPRSEVQRRNPAWFVIKAWRTTRGSAKSVGMLFGKAHAVVADTQAQFAGLSLKLLHIAFAGLSEAVQRGEDAHSSLAIDTANVSLSGMVKIIFFTRLS